MSPACWCTTPRMTSGSSDPTTPPSEASSAEASAARAITSLARGLEEERIGDDHRPAALRLGEDPGAHAAGEALLHLGDVHRGLRDRARRDGAARGDHPADRHLAG